MENIEIILVLATSVVFLGAILMQCVPTGIPYGAKVCILILEVWVE